MGMATGVATVGTGVAASVGVGAAVGGKEGIGDGTWVSAGVATKPGVAEPSPTSVEQPAMLRASRHESAVRTAAWKPLNRNFLLNGSVLTEQTRLRPPADNCPSRRFGRAETRPLYWTWLNTYKTPRTCSGAIIASVQKYRPKTYTLAWG